MIRLDYESYSEVDLLVLGGWRYASDPSTEALCFAYRIDDNPLKDWRYGSPFPEDLASRWAEPGEEIWAFNANFERAITELVISRMFPDVPIPDVSQWRCSQAIAAMCRLPLSLDVCATVLNATDRKDPEGKRLIDKFSKPQRGGKRIRPEDDPKDFKKFVKYCRGDVRAEEAVHNALPVKNLPKREQRLWTLDSTMNSRGVYVDRSVAEGAVKIVTSLKDRYSKKLVEVTNGDITTPGQTQRMVTFADSVGYPIPNCQAATIEDALADQELPEKLRVVLTARQLCSRTSTSKFIVMIEAAGPDGRVRGCIRYHKAGTGRWGGELLQLHNLPRPRLDVTKDIDLIQAGDVDDLMCFYEDPMAVLRDAIRPAVIAEPGFELDVCDFASIEARVLGWLAGEVGYLNAFRNGLDLYKVTAAEIYKVPYEDVTSDQRALGKESVLGLGFGMWWHTFMATCEKKRVSASEDLIKKAVNTYRKKYTAITGYWKEIEKCVKAVIATKRPMKLHPRGGQPVVARMEGTYLTIQLPSGRKLWYPEARLRASKTKWGEPTTEICFKAYRSGHWGDETTYGGRLTENIVQAIARDLLVYSMFLLEKKGMKIVMHVHDEIVAENKKGRFTIKQMERWMSIPPKWAADLPMGAEGFKTNRYRKG